MVRVKITSSHLRMFALLMLVQQIITITRRLLVDCSVYCTFWCDDSVTVNIWLITMRCFWLNTNICI